MWNFEELVKDLLHNVEKESVRLMKKDSSIRAYEMAEGHIISFRSCKLRRALAIRIDCCCLKVADGSARREYGAAAFE